MALEISLLEAKCCSSAHTFPRMACPSSQFVPIYFALVPHFWEKKRENLSRAAEGDGDGGEGGQLYIFLVCSLCIWLM